MFQSFGAWKWIHVASTAQSHNSFIVPMIIYLFSACPHLPFISFTKFIMFLCYLSFSYFHMNKNWKKDKCRWYRAWEKFILVWAIYSSVFTPMEFGFFRGLPRNLFFLDITGQVAFLIDIILQFFVAYRDSQTYRMVYKRTPIALR